MRRPQREKSLTSSSDADPGFSRHLVGEHFEYRRANGSRLHAKRHLARIDQLGIPPAWSDVWICADPTGHLQATGRDSRGRKQYRYHRQWIAEQDTAKFDSLYAFARRLPSIRRRAARDINAPALDRSRVLAAVVQLIDRTFIRVGGERYRRENWSFGATTLRNRHVKVRGQEVFLDFVGKSGKRHRIEVKDPKISAVIRECLQVPGKLFSWHDGHGAASISAAEVNEYIQQGTKADITTKDFRTWGGSVMAAATLARATSAADTRTVRKEMRNAVMAASTLLGNTPAVCRRSYIHPAVFTNYEAGVTVRPVRLHGLRAAEQRMLGLLAPAHEKALVRNA